MKIITIASVKGGVGKSTLSWALSSLLAGKILAIDCDPQGTLTAALTDSIRPGSFELLTRAAPLQSVIHSSLPAYENLKVIPSSPLLSGIEAATASDLSRQYLVTEALENFSDSDYVVIDTPGTLGVLSTAPIVASDVVVTPISCSPAAFDTLSEFESRLSSIRKRLNPHFKWFIAATLYDPRQRLDQDLLSAIQDRYPEQLLYPPIRKRISVSEDMAARSPCGSEDFTQFTQNLKGRIHL